MLTLGRCQADLERLLGVEVDLVLAGDLKPQLVAEILADAVAL